jgi:hypothetical protein
MRKVIREAHNKGKSNKLDSVDVWGVQYRSVHTAWQALKISGTSSAHEKFRLKLKRSKGKRLIHTDPLTGEMHPFRIIPYNSKLP